MEEEGPMAIWSMLVGESDNDEEYFQGFIVEEASDVDLDIVVQEGILQSDK